MNEAESIISTGSLNLEFYYNNYIKFRAKLKDLHTR